MSKTFRFRPKTVSVIKRYLILTAYVFLIVSILIISIFLFSENVKYGVIFLFFTLIVFFYVTFFEPYNLQINYLKTELGRKGVSIKAVQISDIHFGNIFDKIWLDHVFKKINLLKPDIIFITGDFFLRENDSDIPVLADMLKNLDAELGVWAVLGNHDLYSNFRKIVKNFKKAGIKFLMNDAVQIVFKDNKFWLAGVNDPHHGKDKLHIVFKRITDDSPKILLAHTPDIIARDQAGKFDMIFLGHTHGGQMRLPGFRQLITLGDNNKKYISGLYRLNKTLIYVNRGLGMVNLPYRFMCRP